jgi:hypothetical protein
MSVLKLAKWLGMFDWSTFVAGAVGIAGIAGSVISARLASQSQSSDLLTSINAENVRSRVAEKRRIYARFLACANDLATKGLAQAYRAATAEKTSEFAAAVAALLTAQSEVELVGPRGVSQLASRMTTLADYRTDSAKRDSFIQVKQEILAAMKEDLDDSTGPRLARPEIKS